MRNITIDPQPISGGLGAEIPDIDLAAERDDRVYSDIWGALAEHGVIFFRNQKLTPDEFVNFGERFGELQAQPQPGDLDGAGLSQGRGASKGAARDHQHWRSMAYRPSVTRRALQGYGSPRA